MANYPYVNYQQPQYFNQQPFYQPMQAQQPPIQSAQTAIQPTVTPVASQPGFVCRPVASKAEAQAVPTDFSGNMLVMTDIANGAIYTKALDPATGSAQFVTYQRVVDQPTAAEQTANVQYAPLEDVNKAIDALEKKIDDLRYDFETTTYEKVERVVPKKSSKGAAE